MSVIEHKYDGLLVIECVNSNPVGDIDNGGRPLVDPETQLGQITPVCIKRKLRDQVSVMKAGLPGYDMYVQRGAQLRAQDAVGIAALTGQTVDPGDDAAVSKILADAKKSNPNLDLDLRDKMCERFFDVRTFGAVMTTFTKNNLNCGQVRGPVQVEFAQTVDPVAVRDLTIGRVAVTWNEDANHTLGSASVIPYGLYLAKFHISAQLAQKTTGFSTDDLDVLLQAFAHMYDHDCSAWRSGMSVRELFLFTHDSPLGNAPAWQLYDLIDVHKKPGVDVPRAYHDYEITVNDAGLPAHVTLNRLI